VWVARFFVIEGLIGVGKTSLCRILEQERGARLVLEPCDDNPFLASFYADADRYAFPTQMFYLASRFSQQMNLRQGDLFSDLIVSDYLWEKDRLFAEQTLVGHEMALYDRFADLLVGTIPAPEFIVFLDAPTESIVQRIEQRAINAEQVIQPSYLDELRDRYYGLWDRFDASPVYVVNTERLHYVNDDRAKDHMLAMIDGWLAREPIQGAPPPYRAPSRQLAMF
jgi:deoxyguanosine kinase